MSLSNSSRVTDNGNDTVTVHLSKPIEMATGSVEHITMRKTGMVSDLEAMSAGRDENDVQKTKRLIAELTSIDGEPGLPLSVFRKMRASDYLLLANEAGKAITEETDDGPNEPRQTGVSS